MVNLITENIYLFIEMNDCCKVLFCVYLFAWFDKQSLISCVYHGWTDTLCHGNYYQILAPLFYLTKHTITSDFTNIKSVFTINSWLQKSCINTHDKAHYMNIGD